MFVGTLLPLLQFVINFANRPIIFGQDCCLYSRQLFFVLANSHLTGEWSTNMCCWILTNQNSSTHIILLYMVLPKLFCFSIAFCCVFDEKAWSGNSPCVPLHHGRHVASWRMFRFDAFDVWTQELANFLELANICWPTKICRVKAA